jgi:hypothetical protein
MLAVMARANATNGSMESNFSDERKNSPATILNANIPNAKYEESFSSSNIMRWAFAESL